MPHVSRSSRIMSRGDNSAASEATTVRNPSAATAGTSPNHPAQADRRDFFEAFGSVIILQSSEAGPIRIDQECSAL